MKSRALPVKASEPITTPARSSEGVGFGVADGEREADGLGLAEVGLAVDPAAAGLVSRASTMKPASMAMENNTPRAMKAPANAARFRSLASSTT